jgi:hypothetical protein
MFADIERPPGAPPSALPSSFTQQRTVPVAPPPPPIITDPDRSPAPFSSDVEAAITRAQGHPELWGPDFWTQKQHELDIMNAGTTRTGGRGGDRVPGATAFPYDTTTSRGGGNPNPRGQFSDPGYNYIRPVGTRGVNPFNPRVIPPLPPGITRSSGSSTNRTRRP